MTFDQWCKALKGLLLLYDIGGGQVLSNLELNYCYIHGLSINTACDISSDVMNGFSFEQAYRMNTVGTVNA